MNNVDVLFERRLRNRLRAALDSEVGPDVIWSESPAFDTLSNPAGRRARLRGVPLRLLGMAALLILGGAIIAGILAQRPRLPEPPRIVNGWVAYDLDGDLFVARDGAEPKRIVGSNGDGLNQTCPRFSSDGHTLAYAEEDATVDPDGNELRSWTLAIVELDESGDVAREVLRHEYELHSANTLSRCFDWSKDGLELAFVPAWGTASESPLMVASVDGDVRPVFDRQGSGYFHLAQFRWAPDSTKLAVSTEARYSHDPWVESELWLVDLSAGPQRQLLGQKKHAAWPFSWSADGTRIAYADPSVGLVSRDDLETTGVTEVSIAVLDVAGQEAAPEVIDRWTWSQTGLPEVAWAPLGDEIAYLRHGEMVVFDHRLKTSRVLPPVSLDGVDPVVLVRGIGWSPDGRRVLVAVADRSAGEENARTAVIAVDAHGDEPPFAVLPWSRPGESRSSATWTWQGLLD